MISRKISFLCVGLALVLVMVGPIWGQVFSIDLPSYSLNPGWNTQLSLNGNFQSGNTVLSDFSWGVREDWVATGNRYSLELNHDYGTNSGQLYSDNQQLLFRNVRYVNSFLGWEGFISTEYDQIKLLADRTMVGGGVRLTVLGVQDSQVSTNMTYGLGFLNESDTLSDSSNSQAYRLVNYISLLWNLTPTVQLNATVRSLLNTADFGDHRAHFVGIVSVQLLGNISLNSQLNLDYDSRPPVGVLKLDSQFTQGVTWKF